MNKIYIIYKRDIYCCDNDDCCSNGKELIFATFTEKEAKDFI